MQPSDVHSAVPSGDVPSALTVGSPLANAPSDEGSDKAPLPYLCIAPACKAEGCCDCNCAISDADMRTYAIRYAFLRQVMGTDDRERQDAAIDALNDACREPATPEQFDAAIDAAMKATGVAQ